MAAVSAPLGKWGPLVAMLGGALLVAVAPIGFDEATILSSAKVTLSNLLPWLGPWLLLCGATRRPLAAAGWTLLLQGSFYGIAAIKRLQLGLPLVPLDAVAAKQFLQTPELYLRYLEPRAYAMLTAALVALVLLHRFEPARLRARGAGRASALGIGTLLVASLALAAPPWRWLYDRERLEIAVWLPANAARESGSTAYFLHLYLHSRSALSAPDADALAAAKAWYRARSTAAATDRSEPLPDLIVVQSESFMDPGDLAGIDTADYAPDLARLQLQHAHGTLRVPAYGGLTTRTEFEVLTGFPLADEPEVQYPYTSLVHRPLPALPWVLRAAGYRTLALHPYDARFYRRDRVYPLLGFDSFLSGDEFGAADVHGYYVADAALNRRIKELLDAPSPQFLFVITMENHGPWDAGRSVPIEALPALPAGARLSKQDASGLQKFLHHTRRADAALGELAEWVLRRPHPTLLLFYGDHLPALSDAPEAWPFDDGRDAFDQTTPWLLVDNRGPSTERLDLAAAELSGWLLARVGVADEALFAPLEASRQARADGSLAEATRAWHRALVASRLQQQPSGEASALAVAEFARIEDFGPRSIEADEAVDAGLGVWVRFASPPGRSDYLMLGDERLKLVAHEDRAVVAELPLHAARRLLASAATWPLVLVDPIGRRQQVIGSFEVRPRAPRLGGWLGFGAGPFCAAEAFGPGEVAVPKAGDPRVAVWLKAGCIPAGATLVLDGVVLETMALDTVATAWLPPALLATPRDSTLALRTGDQELPIGTVRIHP